MMQNKIDPEPLLAALKELVTLKDEKPKDYELRKPIAWQAARDAIAAAEENTISPRKD